MISNLIFPTFQPSAIDVIQESIKLASAHRTVRCYHLLKAADKVINLILAQNTTRAKQNLTLISKHLHAHSYIYDLQYSVERIGIFDSPIALSPAVEHVLKTCCCHKQKPFVSSLSLILNALALWHEETPSGPFNEEFRLNTSRLYKFYNCVAIPAYLGH